MRMLTALPGRCELSWSAFPGDGDRREQERRGHDLERLVAREPAREEAGVAEGRCHARAQLSLHPGELDSAAEPGERPADEHRAEEQERDAEPGAARRLGVAADRAQGEAPARAA